MKVRFLLKQAFFPDATKGKKMTLAFVIITVYVVVMLGTLIFNQAKWNDRWQELSAGSWAGEDVEEEKLPPGAYTVSWPRVESYWS